MVVSIHRANAVGCDGAMRLVGDTSAERAGIVNEVGRKLNRARLAAENEKAATSRVEGGTWSG